MPGHKAESEQGGTSCCPGDDLGKPQHGISSQVTDGMRYINAIYRFPSVRKPLPRQSIFDSALIVHDSVKNLSCAALGSPQRPQLAGTESGGPTRRIGRPHRRRACTPQQWRTTTASPAAAIIRISNSDTVQPSDFAPLFGGKSFCQIFCIRNPGAA
jgi:hypothetical protein